MPMIFSIYHSRNIRKFYPFGSSEEYWVRGESPPQLIRRKKYRMNTDNLSVLAKSVPAAAVTQMGQALEIFNRH